jgi:DNA-binding NtrC family response regulator
MPPFDPETGWEAAPQPAIVTLPAQANVGNPDRARALVFEDNRSVALLSRVQRIAPSEANVLIIGETGTGKELIARKVHELSGRHTAPFVAVNCGAFSETLMESELFGHEKGAFTGAVCAKAGWFEAADGGTLFLDEIGDLPMSAQVKLLRVLQEREVVRVGSRTPIPIDVRLISATNVRLEEAVLAGHFREDLFYRLQVVQLKIAPLRERVGDILPLARHFIERYRKRLGLAPVVLLPAAEEKLTRHTWPGNIRELENAIHCALLVARNDMLHPDDLALSETLSAAAREAYLGNTHSESLPGTSVRARLEPVLRALFEGNQEKLFERIEAAVMESAWEYCHRNQVQSARLLGISRNILRARLIREGMITALK